MLSSTNSSYSSSNCSSDPHLPYQHQQPLSTLSLGSQHPRKASMRPKYPRFYASPMDDGSESPIQAYGLEQREPSIYERPRLLRRVSHALDDIKEDLAYQLDARETANKIKRRSTFFLDPHFNIAEENRPETSAGTSRSRPMSIMSVEAWTAPQRGLSRRLSRRLSIFGRKTPEGSPMASISSPNLIGSSTTYA
ncbi:hypothetical protein N7523_008290 [Penicillium sp. IBT 18751x]|nr:hypothetical protein N7523_008290 [Penicillium sp. IBT 18751x]